MSGAAGLPAGAKPARPARNNRIWSPEEDAQLLALHQAGATAAGIGERLGRSSAAVWCRLDLLRQAAGESPRPKEKMRPCLRCKKAFRSSHSMNKLCGKCRSIETSPYQP